MCIKVDSVTIVLRLCSGGVERTTTKSIPESLRMTSFMSSSRFGVWGWDYTAENSVNAALIKPWKWTRCSSLTTAGTHQRLQRPVLLHGIFERRRSPRGRTELGLVVGCDKSTRRQNVDTKSNPNPFEFLIKSYGWEGRNTTAREAAWFIFTACNYIVKMRRAS